MEVPDNVDVLPFAMGSAWMLAHAGGAAPNEPRPVKSTIAIRRTDGAIVDLGQKDSLGRRNYPDLDASSLRRRLCRPIARTPYDGLPEDVTGYAIITKSGPWVLQSAADHQYLQRCGRRHIEKFDAVEWKQAVLGAGILAYLTQYSIRIRHLGTHRHRTERLQFPGPERPSLDLAGRRLIVSEPQRSGGYAIYTTREPST